MKMGDIEEVVKCIPRDARRVRKGIVRDSYGLTWL